jgi:hypothetical protein
VRVACPVRRAGRGNGPGAIPGTAPRSDPYYTAVLSQQGGEAGGSLTREVPGRVASGPLCSRVLSAASFEDGGVTVGDDGLS